MLSGEIELITRHYESGELSAAREICVALVEQNYVPPDVLRRVALIALRSDDPTTAAQAMRQALAIAPQVAEYHNILGNALRALGELSQAIDCFRRATELAPDCAAAHSNLGACLLEQGDAEAAVARFQQALAFDPNLAGAHYNLGNAWQLQGRLDDAITSYRQALWCEPDHADAHTNLGAALHQQHRTAEAEQHYRRSLELRPTSPEAHNNLGTLHHDRKEFALAVDCYRRALELNPDYFDARVNLGDALRDQGQLDAAAEDYQRALALQPAAHDVRDKLGTAFKLLSRFEAAEDCYRQILEQLPDSSEAWNSLAIVLQLQERTAEAVESYQKALRILDTNFDIHTNLASAYRELGEFQKATNCCERALRLQPNSSRANLGLADVLCDTRDLEGARHHYDLAVHFDPANADIRMHRGLSLLRMGDFQQGWRDFEWRWKTGQYGPRNFPIPRWNGEPLGDRRILIHGEQGLGDTIQFVRYLDQVKRRGGHVIFACSDELLPLLKSIPGADEVVPISQPLPKADCHAPLLSLPSIFGTTLETIPAEIPYLTVDEELVRRWSERLGHMKGIKVGIGWQGNPQHPRDRFRSISPRYFVELAAAPGITMLSLQKDTTGQTDSLTLAELSQPLDSESGPFMDTSAIMKSLDVVITCDTSLAHLAGALGVRVWVLLDFSADWRWLMDRDDSPWYPTMRLFRQSAPGDWAGVFERVRLALGELGS